MMSVLELLRQLVAFESITPHDVGCQKLMIKQLEALGFKIHAFHNAPVSNFYAQIGTQKPLMVFAGHTDVVPTGDPSKWQQADPFKLEVIDGLAYGRGTADMKGSLAAMLCATAEFLNNHPLNGSIGFLITSGEEGDDFDKGTPYVMSKLHDLGITPDYCIVGEPTSQYKLGDTVKVGRRGSLTAKITIHGQQGHVAYPHLAKNPIHMLAPVLHALTTHAFDTGNDYFAPTSLQVTRIDADGRAGNVIPGLVQLQFNIRYSTEQTEQALKSWIQALFEQHQLQFDAQWQHNGAPFLTEPGPLTNTLCHEITQTCGISPECSTSGGTSDARFIAPFNVEVVEFGPINKSIHQIDEHVQLSDLEKLTTIYQNVMKKIVS